MDRQQKHETVATLKQEVSQANSLMVFYYKGLTVAEISTLRKSAFAKGVQIKVTKNTLTKLALQETVYKQLTDLFEGPTAIGYSEDPIAAAKVVVDFAKTHEKLQIIGGAMGEKALDVASIKSLATLPSLDELRARLVGLIQAPATKLATVINTPAGQLARVLQAHATKDAGQA